jgi:hypothetical protein
MTAIVRRGELLVVKVPPCYQTEYLYVVTGAGNKLIRANLFHSPKVKRSWHIEEFRLLMEMGLVRIANQNETPSTVTDTASEFRPKQY